ncbi:MAG: hypothetical protein WB992_06905 [Bryobacteraceae bacterium]
MTRSAAESIGASEARYELGPLDVFPMNDSSVARNLAFVAGAVPLDIDHVLTALGPERGMLYYHLLLARLDAGGEIGRASYGSGELTNSP